MVSWAINLCSPAAEKDTSSSGKPTFPEKRKWRRNVFNNFHSNSEKSVVNPDDDLIALITGPNITHHLFTKEYDVASKT